MMIIDFKYIVTKLLIRPLVIDFNNLMSSTPISSLTVSSVGQDAPYTTANFLELIE